MCVCAFMNVDREIKYIFLGLISILNASRIIIIEVTGNCKIYISLSSVKFPVKRFPSSEFIPSAQSSG